MEWVKPKGKFICLSLEGEHKVENGHPTCLEERMEEKKWKLGYKCKYKLNAMMCRNHIAHVLFTIQQRKHNKYWIEGSVTSVIYLGTEEISGCSFHVWHRIQVAVLTLYCSFFFIDVFNWRNFRLQRLQAGEFRTWTLLLWSHAFVTAAVCSLVLTS